MTYTKEFIVKAIRKYGEKLSIFVCRHQYGERFAFKERRVIKGECIYRVRNLSYDPFPSHFYPSCFNDLSDGTIEGIVDEMFDYDLDLFKIMKLRVGKTILKPTKKKSTKKKPVNARKKVRR